MQPKKDITQILQIEKCFIKRVQSFLKQFREFASYIIRDQQTLLCNY